MSTRDLVNAIVAGDAASIETAFQTAIAEKISARLDDYRQEVAKNMFKTEQVEMSEAYGRGFSGVGGARRREDDERHDLDGYRPSRSYKSKYSKAAGAAGAKSLSDMAAEIRKKKQAQSNVSEDTKLDVEQIDELDQLALRGMYSTDPKSRQHVGVTTDKGKAARAKKNVPELKSAIKASSGKHPKANLPEETELDEEQLDELKSSTLKSYADKRMASFSREKGIMPGSKEHKQWKSAQQAYDKAAAKRMVPSQAREEVEIQVEQLEVSNVESALYALEEGRNVLDQALAEAVSSDSKNRYEYANGKKPSGRGNWMFSTVHPREHDVTKHKDQTVSVQGTFADAAKKAASHFKEKGHKGEIHVLS